MYISDASAVSSSAISVNALPPDANPTAPPPKKEESKLSINKALTLLSSVWKKKWFFKAFQETYEDFVFFKLFLHMELIK